MLVLSRKAGERIHIGDDIVLTITRCGSSRVAIGIEAPAEVRVLRSEIVDGHLPGLPVSVMPRPAQSVSNLIAAKSA